MGLMHCVGVLHWLICKNSVKNLSTQSINFHYKMHLKLPIVFKHDLSNCLQLSIDSAHSSISMHVKYFNSYRLPFSQFLQVIFNLFSLIWFKSLFCSKLIEHNLSSIWNEFIDRSLFIFWQGSNSHMSGHMLDVVMFLNKGFLFKWYQQK